MIYPPRDRNGPGRHETANHHIRIDFYCNPNASQEDSLIKTVVRNKLLFFL